MSSRNVVIGGLVVGCLVICVCALALAGLGGGWYYTQATRATAAAPTPPAPTPGGPVSPEALNAEMDHIEQQVIEMRGLQPTGPVERKFMTVDEVKQRMMDDFNEDTTPEEWADDTQVLAAYGMVRPDIDLYNLLLRLYSEGVSGFYDPDTGELVIVSDKASLNAYEQVTFAHETNHALQDQNYDLRDGMGFSDEGFEADSEKARAAQALIEGDSSLLDEQYKETLGRAGLNEYNNAIDDIDVSIYAELPQYLLIDFAFPYIQGTAFVRRYYRLGGWERVDEVWRNPPLSTEHILHPERYESGDAPILIERPALTDTLGSGWRQIDSGVSGEWFTYLMLAYGENEDVRLATDDAEVATEGWGGDGYVVFYNVDANQLVLAQHWLWDTQPDADEFNQAFEQYGNRRWDGAETSSGQVCWQSGQQCFFTRGQHSLWLTAPDSATMESVLALHPDLR